MASPDPRVRALAVEVAGYRADGSRYAPELIDRLEDADLAVRERRTQRWCVSPERTWAGNPAPGASWPGNAVGCDESTRPRRLTAWRPAGRFVSRLRINFKMKRAATPRKPAPAAAARERLASWIASRD